MLRIHRRPESRLLDAHVMPSLETALDAVKLALREDAMPSALRVYDGYEARAHLGKDVCRPGQAILVVGVAIALWGIVGWAAEPITRDEHVPMEAH